jgi:protein-L-isoaspartate(D-aspartate) O-methyltransferase
MFSSEVKKADWVRQRLAMVDNQLIARGIKDERVLEVMRRVPRHSFVPEGVRESAYQDSPLAIGEGQTISQPYMVALMTECLGLRGAETVLEIGTGSGYQTAVLAELAGSVYTVERIGVLSERAQQILLELGFRDIHFRVGDGTFGWPEEGPFDGIMVTAAAPDITPDLTGQLKEGGVLVVPVGSRYSQVLCRVVRKRGVLESEEVTPCVFVPLVGAHGWQEP